MASTFWPWQRQKSVDETRKLALITTPSAAAGTLVGGRISRGTSDDWYTASPILLPPPTADGEWSLSLLEKNVVNKIKPAVLLDKLTNMSPDISKAIWDYLRFSNPGFEIIATKIGSDSPDPVAQSAIDDFILKLKALYGSFDIVINRLFMGAFMRGAVLAELVLNESANEPIDIATPDPNSIRFKQVFDPVRGFIFEIGQFQGPQWVAFDRPTIKYLPVDPLPSSPYGRPIVAPAIFSTMFMIGLLQDLRRVVSQQGYPRIDISVDLDILKASMPDSLKGNPKALQEWINSVLEEIDTKYRTLQPDDAYMHTSSIIVNKNVGTVDAGSIGGIAHIIEALERQTVRALKTMPFMMASHQSTSETQANRQYEAHIQGIKSGQHLVESLLEHLFTVALQAQGIQASVEFRFAENRASELFRDQQARQLLLDNSIKAYLAGYIDQNEAAILAVGHKAVKPEPLALPTGYALGGTTAPNPSTVQPEPGVNRALPDDDLNIRLLDVPEHVGYSSADRTKLVQTWNDAMPDQYNGLLNADVVA